jgi:threonine dehydrogenase-like Zn-dependent dehydrogenase
VDVPEPDLPSQDWARIEVATGGICGSDLHMFTHNTGDSPTLVGYVPFPFVLGHEIAGRIIEAGSGCGLGVGTRVAVEPVITCEARGIDPRCPACARGDMSCCQNLDSQVASPGMALGFTAGMGGGWADQVVAHKSMLFPIPDVVPDRAASLHEPVSIAVHGLLRRPPEAGSPVAVVGAGIIGLATVAALRTLCPSSEVTVLARHDHQAAAATATGAHHVVRPAEDQSHFDELAAITGGRHTGKGRRAMIVGGFPYVVEAVGMTSSVNEALRIADNRASVLVLGAAGTAEYDLTLVWWKELALVGSINHSYDPGIGGGPRRSSVARALEILATDALPHQVVVTHEFPLEGYRDAIATAIDRQAGAIKVVFRPGPSG